MATKRAGTESASAASLTVLVAEPEAEPLLALSEELTRRGFAVIPVTTWTAALAALAAHRVHIGVLHGGVADVTDLVGLQSDASLSADRSNGGKETPFIFTIGDAGGFDWDSYACLDSADYVLGPVLAEDLGQRVSALARKLKRRAGASLSADQLRLAVRRVSASIQSTHEPAAMATFLVSGVHDVFGVSQVYFATFDDERVARLSVQQQGRDAAAPLQLGEHEPLVRDLANRLWGAAEATGLGDHDRLRMAGGHPELVVWNTADADTTYLAMPLGDGAAAFGLLWMANPEEPRNWSAMEVSLLRHLAGVAAQALMQGRIITGQQEVVKRLQRLDDAKSNFLRTVNHELRTPLTSLTAYLELIRDGAGGDLPHSALSMLTVVERNAKRLGLLVDDVLTISRMTANPEVDWKPVNMPQLLTGVVQALGDVAGERGVQVELTTTATDLVVEGDAARLRQVFRNLADNAIKFTPAGGHVQVEVRRCLLAGSVAAVDVVVADNGDGIAEEDLPEVFTSFFRGSNAEADAVTGSGLGLAIVRGVVDAHGGAIMVSETTGGGTTISVQLPVHHQGGEQDG